MNKWKQVSRGLTSSGGGSSLGGLTGRTYWCLGYVASTTATIPNSSCSTLLSSFPTSSSAFGGIPSSVSWAEGSRRYAHKYAPPYCPNLTNIRKIVHNRLQPIHFTLKNDPAFGFHIWDMHFRGLLCSPLFEGKTYEEMNEMVRKALTPIGMSNRVRLTCQPPSLFCKMKRMCRQRWPMEK
eukprot:GHVS01021089.1.p1 GENE.GHVS01021089.1~~GHVS01021089.1.p1  ORF type:complete len:181 (-),score=14.59 GHVS01021089.1:71-613(-)